LYFWALNVERVESRLVASRIVRWHLALWKICARTH